MVCFGLALWHINYCRLSNIKLIFILINFYFKQFRLVYDYFPVDTLLDVRTVLFRTIQFSIEKLSHFKQFILPQVRSPNIKAFLFQTIQLSIRTLFSSIWPRDRTLSGASTPGQIGPCSDGNEQLLRISQSSSITGTSTSNCLVSLSGHSGSEVLPLCRKAVSVFHSPNQLGKLEDNVDGDNDI